MRSRRIFYGLTLCAALLFQIFYDRYLARFVLAGVLVLPLLSLLLALPVALGCKLRLTGEGAYRCRGDAGQWELRVEGPAVFPMARLKLRLRFRNDLTGQTEKRRFALDRRAGEGQRFPAPGGHCGRVTCRVTRARMMDCLGLFALPVRRPSPSAVLVLPVEDPLEELPDLEPAGAPGEAEMRQKTPGGDYELREYRAGDPLRAVHWKLSSKGEELVVREWLGERRPRIVLVVDRFGTPEQLDRVLDRFWTLSTYLLERDCPHRVQWEADGQLRTAAVSDQASLLDCLGEMLSCPAPRRGTTMAGRPETEPGVRYFYLSAEEGSP
jgi:uncharacterized protein (DUF58 family)